MKSVIKSTLTMAHLMAVPENSSFVPEKTNWHQNACTMPFPNFEISDVYSFSVLCLCALCPGSSACFGLKNKKPQEALPKIFHDVNYTYCL
jgi:hypothetical protein